LEENPLILECGSDNQKLNKALTFIAGSPAFLDKKLPICSNSFSDLPIWWWASGLHASSLSMTELPAVE